MRRQETWFPRAPAAPLYWFLAATVVCYHKCSGFKHRFAVLQFQRSEILNESHWAEAMMLPGWFFLESPGENPCPGLIHLLEAAVFLGLRHLPPSPRPERVASSGYSL